MNVIKTAIPGVLLIEPEIHRDVRGHFFRAFCEVELATVLGHRRLKQVNSSFTASKHTFRGFHYQVPPAAEMKLIRCAEGAVLDFALDLRSGSPTYLQHVSLELSSENNRTMLLPEGVAHGFQTLTDNCQLVYCHTELHSPTHERGVRHDEPMARISLPHPISNISERDLSFSYLDENFEGVIL